MSKIHHIIELLELYPVEFDNDHMYQLLSSNLNLTFEYVLNHQAVHCKWNYRYLSANSSVATMQTISKVSWNWNFLLLLSNSAFTEEDVTKLLANESLNDLNDDMIGCLGHNKNISPEFEPIKERWKVMLDTYASNEQFIPLINTYIIESSPAQHLAFLKNYIHNRAVTVEMFFNHVVINGPSTHQFMCSEFMNYNPNVLVTDLERFGYRTGTIPPDYLVNINAILPMVLQTHHMQRIASNPHLQIAELLELIENEPYEKKLGIYKEYSSHHNLSWENIGDYSWLSFNWNKIASNSFSNSPQYREVTLMRELLELDCVCDYPTLSGLF